MSRRLACQAHSLCHPACTISLFPKVGPLLWLLGCWGSAPCCVHATSHRLLYDCGHSKGLQSDPCMQVVPQPQQMTRYPPGAFFCPCGWLCSRMQPARRLLLHLLHLLLPAAASTPSGGLLLAAARADALTPAVLLAAAKTDMLPPAVLLSWLAAPCRRCRGLSMGPCCRACWTPLSSWTCSLCRWQIHTR